MLLHRHHAINFTNMGGPNSSASCLGNVLDVMHGGSPARLPKFIYSTRRDTSASSAWRQYPPQLGLLLVGQRAGKHNVEMDPQVAFAAGRLQRMCLSAGPEQKAKCSLLAQQFHITLCRAVSHALQCYKLA